MFEHGSAALRPPAGTIPTDADLSPVPEALPREVPMSMLERGRERFDIFCAPCHSPVGDGEGMVVQRGFPAPPSFHDPGLIAAPDRHFYDVITNGFGVMPDYRVQIDPRDRWRIIAYVKALQLSQPTVAEPAPGQPGATTPPPGTLPEGSPQARPGGRGGQGGQ